MRNEIKQAVSLLWGHSEQQKISGLWNSVSPHLPKVLEKFYGEVTRVPELNAIISAHADVAALKAAQTKHWERLLSNGPTDEVLSSSLAIGNAHARIGLTPSWYISSYGLSLSLLSSELLGKDGGKSQQTLDHRWALQRLTMIDMLCAIDTYNSDVLDSASAGQQLELDIENLHQLALTVTNVNDAAQSLAELVHNERTAGLNSQSIASAAEQLVASVDEIARNSSSAADEAQEANTTVGDGQNAVRTASQAMSDISSAVQETGESVQELAKAAEEIGQILGVIEDIASQTNLLALNATIEAARAGDAGKGFAVVATEVKNLANQTSRSTEDITKKIAALRQSMESIQATMKQSNSAVEGGRDSISIVTSTMDTVTNQVSAVAGRMQEISSILQQQKEASAEIASNVTDVARLTNENVAHVEDIAASIQNSNDHVAQSAQNAFVADSDRALCEMAKIDHVLFKKRVVDTLMQRGDWKSNEVPDHHNCRLGKWYDAVSNDLLRSNPKFESLLGPHERVHAAAKACLDAYHSDNWDDAVAHLNKMGEASTEVLDGLESLAQSLKSQS